MLGRCLVRDVILTHVATTHSGINSTYSHELRNGGLLYDRKQKEAIRVKIGIWIEVGKLHLLVPQRTSGLDLRRPTPISYLISILQRLLWTTEPMRAAVHREVVIDQAQANPPTINDNHVVHRLRTGPRLGWESEDGHREGHPHDRDDRHRKPLRPTE